MEFSAILEIGRQALTVVASLWALQRGYGLIALGAIFAAAAGVQLAAWWILYGIYFPHPRWRADFRRSRQIVRQAAPFGGIVLIGALFPRMDLITVNLLSGDVETGRLNAALVFTALLMYMVGAMQTATFPVFSVLKDAAVSERARIYEKAQKLFTCAAVAIAVGVLILAMPMIRLVFGTRFDSSAVLLRLLSFGLLLHFLAMCSDSALKGLDRESVCLRILMLVCSVNLVLDLALIPYLKAEGAVVGNVVSRLCWVVLSFRALKRMFPELPLTPDLTRILLAGAIMAVPVFVLRDFPVLLVVPLGAVVYGLALLATRAVTLAELRVAVSALWPRSSAASA